MYENPDELWTDAKKGDDVPQWYTSAVSYWDQQEASDNGVLGGYGHLSTPDVRDSRAFLHKVFGATMQAAQQRPLVALDCGAGVGRVTEQLLLHHFQEVDLVEPSGQHFTWCHCTLL